MARGVAMDYLKFHLGLACPTFLRTAGGPPLKRSHHRFSSVVAHPQGRWPADLFYPFGHATPYAYAFKEAAIKSEISEKSLKYVA
jgi:hypothetical protein